MLHKDFTSVGGLSNAGHQQGFPWCGAELAPSHGFVSHCVHNLNVKQTQIALESVAEPASITARNVKTLSMCPVCNIRQVMYVKEEWMEICKIMALSWDVFDCLVACEKTFWWLSSAQITNGLFKSHIQFCVILTKARNHLQGKHLP